VTVLLAVVVAAGCGSAASPAGPSGWLSISPDGVAFLTWTRTDTTLSGSLTWVHTTPAVAHVPVAVTAAVTGTVNGQSVTLSLAPVLTAGGTWSGSLDSERLTLSYTADDGSIATITFVPKTIDDYNSALGAFRAAEQAALLADQSAAASAAAYAAARECSIRVVYNNAMIEVHGDNARNECARFAASIPKDPGHTFGWDPSDAWGPVQQPIEVVADVINFGRVVCSGTIDSFSVAVWDTGGAHYGSIACQSLGLGP
jgi:hypothetical protein